METMDLLTTLGTYLGLLTPVGGITVFFYRKQAKKLKDAEVKLAEISIDKAKIETRADDWHIWREQNERLGEANLQLIERNQNLIKMNAEKEDRHQQDIKDWEGRFDSQTDRLREIQRALTSANAREVELTRRLGEAELERDHYKQWMCKKPWKQCKEREPEQAVKHDKYIPLNNDNKQ